ncbi:18878_t:CDS:2, partial [Funneliformis geosporum]
DNIVQEIVDYTIYDALQNVAKAWSMVSSQTISNCWKKTGILPPNNEFEEVEDDDSVVSDSDINMREYIHIEDEMLEGRLTDEEIVDSVLNTNKEEENVDETEFMPEKISPAKVEKSIDEIIRFLYKQESEFGEVN